MKAVALALPVSNSREPATPPSATTVSGVRPTPAPEVLKAAREFEAIFLRTLLGPLEKSMRFGKNAGLSAGQSAYGSMVVTAMADAMTAAGGIGLSEVVARALSATPAGPSGKQP